MAKPGSRPWVVATVAALATLVALAIAGPASAVPEPAPVLRNCGGCHEVYGYPCERCHEYPYDQLDPYNSDAWFKGTYASTGPHGKYSTTTRHCEKCHTLHDADTSFKLLPGTTVKATCFTCHDGTGGDGVYGAIKVRTGSDPAGGHAIESTNVVPGGDASTGGSATVAFRGPSSSLTCSDCHSPHGSNTVDKFVGERIRVVAAMQTSSAGYSDRLLKKRPTGATADVNEYGSDWCAACHKGRTSGGMVMNHPVDSGAGAYAYDRVPVNWTSLEGFEYSGVMAYANGPIRIGSLGYLVTANAHFLTYPAGFTWQASGWLMKYPRAPLQVGHAPLCQQCHEDSREVGELRNNGSEVWMQSEFVYPDQADGRISANPSHMPANPRFQNFPHETENTSLLLETGDDLCLNCHPPGVLP